MACISITCSPVGAPVQLAARQEGTPVQLTARPTATPVQLTCSLVCTVDVVTGRVEVVPQYVWLMEDNSYQADVDVLSNRNWTIG